MNIFRKTKKEKYKNCKFLYFFNLLLRYLAARKQSQRTKLVPMRLKIVSAAPAFDSI